MGLRKKRIRSLFFFPQFLRFNYPLHGIKELSASVVGDVEGGLTEVSSEEIVKAGQGVVLRVVVWVLAGEGRLEETGGLHSEALQVGVEELTCRVNPRSLEGVAGNHGGVSVIFKPLQSTSSVSILQATHLRVLNQDLV